MPPDSLNPLKYLESFKKWAQEARASTLFISDLVAAIVLALNWAPFPDWLMLNIRILAFFAVVAIIICTSRLWIIAVQHLLDTRSARRQQEAAEALRQEEAIATVNRIYEQLDQMVQHERMELFRLVEQTKAGRAYNSNRNRAYMRGAPDISRCLWDLSHSRFVRDVSPPGYTGSSPSYMANQVLIDYVDSRADTFKRLP